MVRNEQVSLRFFEAVLMKPLALFTSAKIIFMLSQSLRWHAILSPELMTKISIMYLLMLKLVSLSWFTFNLIHWSHQKFKAWNTNEILLIFSLPLVECAEGMFGLAKIHMALPTLKYIFSSTKFCQGLLQLTVTLVILRLLYIIFYRLNKYFRKSSEQDSILC